MLWSYRVVVATNWPSEMWMLFSESVCMCIGVCGWKRGWLLVCDRIQSVAQVRASASALWEWCVLVPVQYVLCGFVHV